MTRTRLIALHALALTMTIATMTLVAVATSPRAAVEPPVRWVVIALGGMAAIASLAFARSALRELERTDLALRRAHQAVRPEIADHEATLADLAEIRRSRDLEVIAERAAQIERRLGRVQPIGSTKIPVLVTTSGEGPRLLR